MIGRLQQALAFSPTLLFFFVQNRQDQISLTQFVSASGIEAYLLRGFFLLVADVNRKFKMEVLFTMQDMYPFNVMP